MSNTTSASAAPSHDERTTRLIAHVNDVFGEHADRIIRDTLDLRHDAILPAFTAGDLDEIDALLRRAWVVNRFVQNYEGDADDLQIAIWAGTVVILQVKDEDHDLHLFQGLLNLGFTWLPPIVDSDPLDWRIVRGPAQFPTYLNEGDLMITHQIENGDQHVGWLAIQA